MTGTPLDLTPFGALLKGIGWLYWIAALGCAALALWWFKRWWLKLGVAAAVLAVFIVPAAKHMMQRQAQYDVAKTKLDAAMAHFQMRCKNAGETITRTVENVDGVVWMRWRDKYDVNDDYDQFKLSDPYGRDCRGKDCIEQLLRLDVKNGRFEREAAQTKDRYRYVESIDPADGKRYRYVGGMKPAPSWTTEAIEDHRKKTGKDIPDFSYRFTHDKQPIDNYSARYGITWDDISTRVDREFWIAGGSIKVIDLQTNEVIAERIGYMMDRGLGSTAGGRSPWPSAPDVACPPFTRVLSGGAFRGFRSHQFILNVLQPSK